MEGNNVRTFENLCKIFEMRIKLDREKKVKTPSDVLINYEKYAKKIEMRMQAIANLPDLTLGLL